MLECSTYKSGSLMLLQLIGLLAGHCAGCAGVLLLSQLEQCAGFQYPGFPPALTMLTMLKQVRRSSCAFRILKTIVACVNVFVEEEDGGAPGVDSDAMRDVRAPAVCRSVCSTLGSIDGMEVLQSW